MTSGGTCSTTGTRVTSPSLLQKIFLGHQRQEALERRNRGEALTKIARTFGVGHSNISRRYEASFLRVALYKKPWRYSRGFSAEERPRSPISDT